MRSTVGQFLQSPLKSVEEGVQLAKARVQQDTQNVQENFQAQEKEFTRRLDEDGEKSSQIRRRRS